MIENIDVQDVITLDDNKEYVVAGKAVYDDIDYLHLVNVDDLSVKFAAIADNKAIILRNNEDRELIEELTPLFIKSTSDALTQLFNDNEELNTEE
jgi:hypothetical protein